MDESDKNIESKIISDLSELKNLIEQQDYLEIIDSGLTRRIENELDSIKDERTDSINQLKDTLVDYKDVLKTGLSQTINDEIQLLESGEISDDEFEIKKNEIIHFNRFLKIFSADKNLEFSIDLEEIIKKHDGEKVLNEAISLKEKTIADIESRLKAEKTVGVVSDSKALYDEIAGNIRDAKRLQYPPNIIANIEKIKAECKAYWDDKREKFEETITLKQEGEYEKLMTYFEKVLKNEGEEAKVEYYTNPETAISSLVKINDAIYVCDRHWKNFLNNRFTQHLDKADEQLELNNPPRAKEELDAILSPEMDYLREKLSADVNARVNLVDKACNNELSKFNDFENEIYKRSKYSPSIEAWSALQHLIKEPDDKRFTENSSVWLDKTKDVRKSVVLETQTCLQQIKNDINDNKLVQAKDYAVDIKDPIEPYKSNFQKSYDEILRLIDLVEQLETELPKIDDEIKARNFESAGKRIEKNGADLEDLGIIEQRRYLALQNKYQLFNNTDDLLESYQERIKKTENSAKLNEILTDIESNIDSVPEEYEKDFNDVRELCNAKFSFYLAKEKLDVMGDYEEAEQLYKIAVQHPNYHDRAKKEIQELEKTKLPANEKVKNTLDELTRLRNQKDYWTAWNKINKVEKEPAQNDLKVELNQNKEEFRKLIEDESFSYLETSMMRGEGDPTLLRDHVNWLRRVNNQRYEDIQGNPWVLIYRLEAESAAKTGKWKLSSEKYQNASDEASNSNDHDEVSEAENYQNYSKGALKQYVLDLYPKLIIEEAIIDIDNNLEHKFKEDPDLMQGKSDIYEKKSDGLEDKENFREAIRKMNQAIESNRLSLQYASRWMRANGPPTYEVARNKLLYQDSERVSEERIENGKQKIEIHKDKHKVLSIKDEIFELLPKL